MFDLHGKVALVTGGGSGIGRACAIAMARMGAAVMITGTSDASASAAVAQIRDSGGTACSVRMDLACEADIAAAVDATVEAFGRMDILHNNAAFAPPEMMAQDIDILAIPTGTWDAIMQGSVRGAMLASRHAILAMRRTGGGSIINTTSLYGLRAFSLMPAYSVSKAAIDMLTRNVAARFGRDNIRCNAVAPGMVDTPMLERAATPAFIRANADAAPLGRIAEPTDIAGLVAFLASDCARHITGQTIAVDAGASCVLPTFAFEMGLL